MVRMYQSENNYPRMNQSRRAQEKRQIERDMVDMMVSEAEAVVETRVVTNWMDRGLCTALNPDFFDISDKTPTDIKMARMVCNACSVRVECREDILNQPSSYEGSTMWAGMTPREINKARDARIDAAKRRASMTSTPSL